MTHKYPRDSEIWEQLRAGQPTVSAENTSSTLAPAKILKVQRVAHKLMMDLNRFISAEKREVRHETAKSRTHSCLTRSHVILPSGPADRVTVWSNTRGKIRKQSTRSVQLDSELIRPINSLTA